MTNSSKQALSNSGTGTSPTKRKSENLVKPVSNLTLLSIGITAGVIAVAFPRLLPYLSEADQSVTITLFTTRFIFVAAFFSLLIGASMIWLYMGTKEHTKNLFMSALALPAVLSGGINMSSFTSAAQNTIADLNRQTIDLQEELKKQNNIEVRTLNLGVIQPASLGFVPSIIGISTAHAQEQSAPATKVDNSSVKIDALSLDRNFMIMLGSSNDKNVIDQENTRIQNLGIKNVITYEIGNKYYLLQNESKTKTTALLDAITIQKQYGLTPVLIKTN